jgi:hypothetical protein
MRRRDARQRTGGVNEATNEDRRPWPGDPVATASTVQVERALKVLGV